MILCIRFEYDRLFFGDREICPMDGEMAHDSEIDCIAISANRRWLVSCDEDGLLRIWDTSMVETPLVGEYLYPSEKQITSLCIEESGTSTIVGALTRDEVWTLRLDGWLVTLDDITVLDPPEPAFLRSIVFHPEGFLLRDTTGQEIGLPSKTQTAEVQADIAHVV